jgi:hypothetical protein
MSYGMAEQPVKYLLSQTNPPANYSLADFKFTAEQFADQKWAAPTL